MTRILPGHFKAITFILLAVLCTTAFATTKNLGVVGGIALLILGMFFADQATHLAQENHSDIPPTKIERLMQKYRLLFVWGGVVLAAIGCFVALYS